MWILICLFCSAVHSVVAVWLLSSGKKQRAVAFVGLCDSGKTLLYYRVGGSVGGSVGGAVGGVVGKQWVEQWVEQWAEQWVG